MQQHGADERLEASDARNLLADCQVLRCTRCGLMRVERSGFTSYRMHPVCGGRWKMVEDDARALVLQLLAS